MGMMKEILKRVIPEREIARFRLGSERKKYFLYLNALANEERLNADFLFGAPLHKNLGDHLITLAEYDLLERNGQKRIIEIPTDVFQLYKSSVLKVVPAEAVIFINGGGWLGNLWPDDELNMQDIVESFSEHKVIIFPQTIYYDEKAGRMPELIQSGIERYSRCKNLTLCVRDYESYVLARRYYAGVDIRLMPDIALSYSIQFSENRQKGSIGICLRGDRESVVDADRVNLVKAILLERGYRLREVSTMSQVRVSEEKREEMVKQKLKEFYESDFIVTDRLHGMIFAYLVGTPCIVFDNRTRKVSGVYKQWLSECDSIFPAFGKINRDELIFFLEKTRKKITCANDIFKKMFDEFMREKMYG